MATEHLDELFSDAVDGRLDRAARRRFEDHLAGCDHCRAGFAQFQQAVSLVRELPQAPMPVPVRLPKGAPVVERAPLFEDWGARLSWLLRPSAQWGALGAAVAGVALFALLIHAGKQTQQNGASGAGGAAGPVVAAPQPTSGCVGCQAGVRAGSAGCTLVQITLAPGQPQPSAPASFADMVLQASSQRPGGQLTLATVTGSYRPGSQVLVYARFTGTDSTGHSVSVVPCVSMESAARYSSVQNLTAPNPVIGGTPDASVHAGDGLPFLDVTIPGNVPPGTQLTITATVPAGTPAGASAPISAELTITVT